MAGDEFWLLSHLSDEQLLSSLQSALCTKRRALAEVVAHLAEVEERRLHLQAACSSLFYYCVQRLHMSEDEACRRIELARLARKFPALYDEIAAGRISLSVALLLIPMLSPDNHAELIAAARGASLQKARELLAARFPRPDAPTQLRKLPERVPSPAQAPSAPANIAAPANGAAVNVPPPAEAPPSSAHPDFPSSPSSVQSPTPAPPQVSQTVHWEPPRPPTQRIEPLSAARYRVQFTADAALKDKIERARDLLRHAYPDGELATILHRALDLLIEDVIEASLWLSAQGGLAPCS